MAFSNRSKSSFGLDDITSRKLAIESAQNIANVKLPDADLESIAGILRGQGPMPVAALAAELSWTADRAAEALARGGQNGVLNFRRADDATLVELSRVPG